ncbi:UPF0481 protein At3g47200-like [Corylus avellana]|uniref:UPF0481 protein At3g47200-like n=1 Tax=Corylus avellana TaxID=13451 RepID=UPI00286B50D8|nr:UPF0481 protein At3g47200-like [Corylus avellana]
MEKKPCSAVGEWTLQPLQCKVFLIDTQPELVSDQWRECYIYRVPKQLRKVNEEAYTPKLVSIGPFHNGRKELSDMEIQKVIYWKKFCIRAGKSQKDLTSLIEPNKEKITRCYSETFEVTEAFVEMILLDAIFIIELFLRYSENPEDKNDYILSKPWRRSKIVEDLMLLENQLPYYVLIELYESASNDTPFLDLACKYLGLNIENEREKDPLHFVDLDRTYYLPQHLKPTNNNIGLPPSATKLEKAGVRFKPFCGRGLLDIQFMKNKCLKSCPFLNCFWYLNCLPCLKCSKCLKRIQPLLKVPLFTVDDQTEHIFRNFMAFEQCHYPWESYICNYVLLLGCLLNKEEDVDLLVEKKVIVNGLGSNAEVMTLINKLGYEIMEVKSCYSDLAQQLNDHCGNYWNRNMSLLTTAYFPDIWRGTASFVGLIALGLLFWNFLRAFVMKV